MELMLDCAFEYRNMPLPMIELKTRLSMHGTWYIHTMYMYMVMINRETETGHQVVTTTQTVKDLMRSRSVYTQPMGSPG